MNREGKDEGDEQIKLKMITGNRKGENLRTSAQPELLDL